MRDDHCADRLLRSAMTVYTAEYSQTIETIVTTTPHFRVENNSLCTRSLVILMLPDSSDEESAFVACFQFQNVGSADKHLGSSRGLEFKVDQRTRGEVAFPEDQRLQVLVGS